MDMTQDVFADQNYGKAALQKMAPTDPNFRLYLAGWLGEKPPFEVMEVRGAVFRHATRGPNKGKLAIRVPGTTRTVHVTAAEIASIDATA
jgi:hypothetical protein